MTTAKKVYLVSNGDLRQPACLNGWPLQEKTLKQVRNALKKLGFDSEALPSLTRNASTGF